MRTRDYSTLLVVDLEATCWRQRTPTDETSEIIEIGVAPLNLKTLEVGEKASIIVRPTESSISEFCTELTTLTQEQVDAGISFEDACQVLRKEHRSGTRIWASFGEFDRRLFVEQCERRGVPYPFGPDHMNVKTALALARGRSPVGMKASCKLVGHEIVGTHHRGDDDAWNTAHLFATLLRQSRRAFTETSTR
ncbi:MAG: inhibitor of KinA sporulation pathway (predicted exonuclease) [Bradymonadia bacterium]|jgi:inhibitor of KinA sporulation pathway (predicted exonuclease)